MVTDDVPNLVRDLPHSFELVGRPRLCGDAGVLGHRVRDGRVEAAIQDVEFSVVIGAFCSTANSMIAWQMSP